VLGVLAARDLDHAIELQNGTDFGLTGGLHSLDPAEVDHWSAQVQVGNAYVNRTTTGAIVRRQPFGGWKRSVVGPGAKAGGPAYVASLARWRDRPGTDRLGRARSSYPGAWAELATPVDPSGLLAERNELRHVALPAVLLRVEAGADPTDEALARLAAETVGTRLHVSRAEDEPVAALAVRLGAGAVDRIRVVGAVPDALWQAAADAWVHLDDRVPVADGRIELRRWCREQSVSVTAHRHGTPIVWTPGPAAGAE